MSCQRAAQLEQIGCDFFVHCVTALDNNRVVYFQNHLFDCLQKQSDFLVRWNYRVQNRGFRTHYVIDVRIRFAHNVDVVDDCRKQEVEIAFVNQTQAVCKTVIVCCLQSDRTFVVVLQWISCFLSLVEEDCQRRLNQICQRAPFVSDKDLNLQEDSLLEL